MSNENILMTINGYLENSDKRFFFIKIQNKKTTDLFINYCSCCCMSSRKGGGESQKIRSSDFLLMFAIKTNAEVF